MIGTSINWYVRMSQNLGKLFDKLEVLKRTNTQESLSSDKLRVVSGGRKEADFGLCFFRGNNGQIVNIRSFDPWSYAVAQGRHKRGSVRIRFLGSEELQARGSLSGALRRLKSSLMVRSAKNEEYDPRLGGGNSRESGPGLVA